MEEGKQAHDVITTFHNLIITSMHPEPPEDAESKEGNNYSNFIRTSNPNLCYPCAVDLRQILKMSPTEINTNVATRTQ